MANPDAKDPVERESSRVQAVMAWFPPTDLVNWGMTDGYITINKLRPDLLAQHCLPKSRT